MQESYYIFTNEGEVIAIFQSEDFARDYLYHLGLDEGCCKIGMLPDNTFNFEEHDSKYHTMENSSLNTLSHRECSRYRPITESVGYCFLTDEQVNGFKKCCTMVEEKK